MSLTIKNIIQIIAFILLFASCSEKINDKNNPNLELNMEIANKSIYQKEKEAQIQLLRDSLALLRNKANPELEYTMCNKLYNEYVLLQSDSAYNYSIRLKQIANIINTSQYITDSGTKYCQVLYNSGYYKETLDSLSIFTPDIATVSHEVLSNYYQLYGRTYYMLAEVTALGNFSERYTTMGNQLFNNALKYASDSLSIYTLKARIASRKTDYENARYLINQGIKHLEQEDDRAAILYTMLAKIEYVEGNKEGSLKYNSMAAIVNIRNVTKDALPLINIANILSKDNNKLDLASEYLSIALADAHEYGAFQRIKQIDSILPVIEAEKLDIIKKHKYTLTILVIVAAILLIVIIIAFVISIQQSKKLSNAKRMLQETNRSLSESNMIKNEYLGHYLVENSELTEMMNRISRMAKKYVRQNKHTDISSFLEEGWSDKKNSHDNFDQIFLKIYPNFIEEFNSLVQDSAKIHVAEPNSLTPTLRIFALIRLDIVDSTTISRILNCSLNTVYNYRTRIKNKAVVDKDEFETYVKKIGY